MRYIELFENVDIDSPEFKKWFSGSKVVDDFGNPLLVYHGGLSWDGIEEFRPLSHFGSLKAANKRIKDKTKHVSLYPPAAIYPVYLSIKNPIKIVDQPSTSHSISNILDYFAFGNLEPEYRFKTIQRNKKYGKITIDEYHDINDIYRNSTIENAKKEFIKLMVKKSYDGLNYVNRLEDRGSISWVVFHANQIWSLFSNHPNKINT